MCRRHLWVGILGLIGLGAASTASAQFAVIDVGAIANLVQQLQTMRQQLDTTHAQLTQARQTLEAMRGGRGMERLLAGTVRNYLPPSWPELESAVNETSTAYGALASQFQALVRANAVLSPQALALLSERDRRELEAARRSAALMQVTTRQALVASSDRFNSLQRLIDAIPSAEDQKAVLDLQARIAAEQGMLMNEQIKLTMLNQAAQAEEQARKQRLREEALLAIGSLRDLPPIGL